MHRRLIGPHVQVGLTADHETPVLGGGDVVGMPLQGDRERERTLVVHAFPAVDDKCACERDTADDRRG